MTKTEIARITKSLEAAEKVKASLAAARDDLRKEVEDLEDILESIDRACEYFESGMRDFQDAIDAASELV